MFSEYLNSYLKSGEIVKMILLATAFNQYELHRCKEDKVWLLRKVIDGLALTIQPSVSINKGRGLSQGEVLLTFRNMRMKTICYFFHLSLFIKISAV